MHASTPRNLVRFLLVSFALVAATSSSPWAEDADGKPGRIGPGAPPAAPAAKPAPKPATSSRIHLAPVVPVAPSARVHEKVLDQCRIQSELARAVADRASAVELTDKPGARRLELKIVDVHAPSGGWFSGPKWVTVEGRLLDGKTVKGDFLAKETSMASASNCGMLSKVIAVLGADIAAWLDSPSKGARLGNAR